ncbi:hypothetical protein MUN81_19225 [Hymenobacter sp. 5317J-9]|uniref:hypothetical protein n=1 Tax=Hymenobacter sp. 5317J-9 TaxID=2932250 RepID=UPI001FD6FC2D|nr:hypothetical protein [Hymenobacter sp. 5317J-9]UOQ97356.1 hypothetical protein MUN81_19225 [Hymenobacter sp. 5317J-9]
MKKLLLYLLGGVMCSAMTGCVVYMPMQCAAPQITDKNQGELSLSTYLNGRAEIAGTYSPARHVLVRAAFSNLRSNSQDSTYYRGHQFDVGVGTYWPLGHRLLLGGLGGFGKAQSAAAFTDGGFLFGRPSRHEYDARYNKVFGEIYGTLQASEGFSIGAAYRVTQVNFTTLTDQNVPVDLSRMTRSEPMLYLRWRLGYGNTEDRPVQLQAAWGTSGTFGYYDGDRSTPYPPGVRDLKQTRSYAAIGITLFPHCLFRKDRLSSEGR